MLKGSFMRTAFPLKFFIMLGLLLLVSACAKTNVRTNNEIAYTGMPRPSQVLVYRFAVSPDDIKQNSSFFAKLGRNMEGKNQTAEEIELGNEVADALASELTEKIKAMGLNAFYASTGASPPANAIVVTGRFLDIDEGNRLRRNMIGFGAGKSSVDVNVSVMAPGSSGYVELIGFDAHADSGNMPGAAVSGGVGAAAGAGTAAVLATNAAVSGVKSYKSSSAQQARKIGEKIAEELGKYFAQQGWIDPSLAK
jgi:hypothetical protein